MRWNLKRPQLKVIAILAGLAAAATAWCAPQVDVFTPQGQAKGVRQAAARFAEPMVSFGDTQLADPFSVRCDGDADRLKGRGRWADPKNWIYDFDADLPAGQRCQFALKPDLRCSMGSIAAPGTKRSSRKRARPSAPS